MSEIKWGIIGTGKIAGRFAGDLKLVEGARLIGAAGRSFSNTTKFTEEFGGKAFSSVTELLASDVHVIYVATPHPDHKEHALLAIQAGKAVLCEKPFTMDLQEAQEIILEANKRKVFVMEGMWTRFFPAIREVISLVNQGRIGKLRRVETSFGYASPFDPLSRVFDPVLGGGSLLDVGVYSIALAHMLISERPSTIGARADMVSTGVDGSCEWELVYPSGVVAQGKSSVVEILKNEAILKGEEGVIRIPRFWCPKEYFLNGEKKEFSYEGLGFQFEAQEVMDCLKAGRMESELVSHRFTSEVMETMDSIRERIGLRYPSRSQT